MTIRKFNTDQKTYINGLRYRIAIKYSDKTRKVFWGPKIGQFGKLVDAAKDGAYINFDGVEARAQSLVAEGEAQAARYRDAEIQKIFRVSYARAYNQALDEAQYQIGHLLYELNRVMNEALASRRTRKWAQSNVVFLRDHKQFLEAAE